jgi:hypothetical protein
MKKPTKPPRIRVTDHAVLRYLERSGQFDIEALRRNIAQRLQPAANAGASSVIVNGVVFIIGSDENGPTVITVLPRNSNVEDHRWYEGRR